MTPEVHEQPGRGSAAHRRRWRILGLLGVAQLMLILDVTVVAIALPRIEIDLGLSRAVVTWTVSAYTLTFGGLLLLGGLLTAGPGWPWVFYINVPIGLVIAAAIARMVPHQRPAAPWARLDVLGALLVTAASGVLVYALISAGDHGWLTATTGWLLLLAAAGYLAFVMQQKTAGTPLLDVTLLTRRPVATGTFLILMATALMIAVFFLGTFYFQHAQGYGPLQTGLLFLPVALAAMLGASLTGRAIARLGARRPAMAGALAAAIGMTMPALSMHPATVVAGMTTAAAGTGAMFVVASATALGQVAAHESGVASGIVSTFHEFGASLGAAVISSAAAASLAGETLTGFTNGFTVAAAAAGAAALLASVLAPGRPATAPSASDTPQE